MAKSKKGPQGPRMIDVSSKPPTLREAVARGEVKLKKETLQMIRDGLLPKGDVLATARVAGIMAAKETPRIVPLCHPLSLSEVAIDLRLKKDRVEIETRVVAFERTGVEMEAMAAVSAAALTIYDMCKGVDRTGMISRIRLVRKSGGRSGLFKRRGEKV